MTRSSIFLWLLAAWALPLSGVRLAAESAPCAETARKVRSDVAARPERVLLLVEDALVVDGSCACEVTKAAILASKASPKLVGQIVFTAVQVAPANAAVIAECAAATSPEASAEIKAALAKALGDQAEPLPAAAPASSAPPDQAPAADPKNPAAGKNPPDDAPTDSDGDFGLSPVAIGGVYLVFPSGGGSRPVVVEERREITRQLVRRPRVIIVASPTPTASVEPPPP